MPRLLSWIGLFSARHRILVVSVWVVILGALSALTGVALSSPAEGDSAGSTPATSASKALEQLQKEFPTPAGTGEDTNSLHLVVQASDGSPVWGKATASVEKLIKDAALLPNVATASDPLDPARPYVSKDGTTAVATLTFRSMTDQSAKEAYDDVVTLAGNAPADLHVEVGGELVASEVQAFGAGEVVGILVAFVVLLLTFGSMLAAGANLLVALSGVAVGTLGILGFGAISPIQDTTLTLATMLGLAVGIDYSLFILTRFRAELRDGRTVTEAVGRATGTAGTAVVFAGLTVIIALVGLSVVQISFITEMGIAGAFGVLVAVLMSLTLLPVLLRSLGRRVLPRSERITAEPGVGPGVRNKDGSFFGKWAAFLVHRPVVSVLAGVIVLLIVALPMLSMKTASNVPGGSDPDSTERRAYSLIVEKFGGVQSPLLVLASGNDVAARISTVQERLADLPGAQTVLPGKVNARGDVAMFTVIPAGGPIDDVTKDLVKEIREESGSVSGTHLEVTGETAMGIDTDAVMNQALVKFLIVIVSLSFVLLVLLFRSILVPLVATLGFLLSVGASFGGSVAVFQWGWLDAIIPAPQGDPMLSILPIILVGVLFGLAMDYQLFLVSRIQELHRRGASPKEAITSGFGKSAPVLVAAAAIMAFVFAGFASSPMAVAASIAFGLVVGVIADAFVVRLVLMPALLALLGEKAWWLPTWLDRLLPNLDAEGHSLDDDTRSIEPEREPSLVQ
ncbi:MMPL family transporter [Arthrobacter sp. UC242_113]|uniref:MMPL family transporter n=1 Tax=Arthrobacter sp. UC242_113 TaxID=3374550 RepID=UPI003757FDF6